MKLRQLFGRIALASSLAGLALTAPAIIAPVSASADVPLPAPSPHATVSQIVGVTNIAVDYSSPAVRGRKIFGALVPFGELWRTGANGATTVEFSTDATIAGKKVPAGKYSLLTIPTAKSWTIILNSDAALGGTRGYDEKKDVVRFEAKPEKIPKRERLSFIFSDTTDDATRIDLEWDVVRVSIPVQVATASLTMNGIKAHLKDNWRPLANASRYLLDTGSLDEALSAVDASIAIQPTWFNVWIKARIHAAKNDFKGAYPLAEMAMELGNKDEFFFWKSDVEAALTAWKAKL